MGYGLLQKLLFSLDAETAHNLALSAIRKGWVKTSTIQDSRLHRNAFGIDFPNPIGLAAGFDKNGLALNQWKNLGFGFIEVGTVTRHAQPGNPKPRLFRIPSEYAIVNRMGFNNQGADALAKRLEKASPGIPVGVNIGKSKVTELVDAPEDYAYSFKLLSPLCDYIVVNVSSPNTPGLRTLQDKEPLTKILWRLREIDGIKPLLVKISPDMEESGLDDVVEAARDFGLAGIVATNTSIRRDVLSSNPNQDGGLSGRPIRLLANETLKSLKQRVGEDLEIIGVGGIESANDIREKFELGASLVQVYSGWVYNGPNFVNELCRGLLEPTLATPSS
ncbi:quinone-dependent dihydroorotate dehydrogenase [Kamptonema cortianum]|nr:quinone-dependent dihydroorotate dehydrogenase [Geitlerinema splendidum]MDK3162204.1 quinone-dependent dihydroorotate dehydrogenase [Kamptonema cortianum]